MLGLGMSATNDTSALIESIYVNAKSLEIDGTTDHVDVNMPHSPSGDPANTELQDLLRGAGLSISMWVYDDWSGDAVMCGYSDVGTNLYMSYGYISGSLDYFSVTHKVSGESSASLLIANPTETNAAGWVHVVYSNTRGVDNSTDGSHQLYINGTLRATSATNTKDKYEGTTLSNGHAGFAFGGLKTIGGGTTSNVSGKIDECAIWNVPLDADAVSEIYNSGAPTDLTEAGTDYTQAMVDGLQRYYRFEGSDLTKDYSTNNVAATLEGDPVSSSSVPS